MSKKNAPFFVARRLVHSDDGDSRGAMIRIAVATTAIAVAVMIISVAVVSGFKREVAQKLTGFASALQIVNYDSNNSFETVPVERIAALEDSLTALLECRSFNIYALKGGVAKTNQTVAGIVMKGVDSLYDWSFFRGALREGNLPHTGGTVRHKEVLISERLAAELDVRTGDRLEFMFVEQGRLPRRDRYKVCGLYNTGLADMDNLYVLTDIANVRRLNGWSSSQITGYEISLKNFDRLDAAEDDIYRMTLTTENEDNPLMVVNVVDKYPNIFDWLKAHNVNAAVIITIMLIVALLSVLSAMLIMLLERTRMIGVLKAMGMSDGGIQRIFLYRAAYIVALGTLIGDAVGVAFCLTQNAWHYLRLDSDGYFLDSVPVNLNIWQVLAIDGGTMLIIVAVLALPTLIISRIKPDKTIRFQ